MTARTEGTSVFRSLEICGTATFIIDESRTTMNIVRQSATSAPHDCMNEPSSSASAAAGGAPIDSCVVIGSPSDVNPAARYKLAQDDHRHRADRALRSASRRRLSTAARRSISWAGRSHTPRLSAARLERCPECPSSLYS